MVRYSFYSSESFLISNHNRFVAGQYTRRMPPVFIGEFGLSGGAAPGSLRAAIGEACFLAGVENGQEIVRCLAYAPVLGNTKYKIERYPVIFLTVNRLLFLLLTICCKCLAAIGETKC